jgi:paraquat-inducible protein B
MNNEWQKLNDQVQVLGDKLIKLAEESAKTDVTENRRKLQSMVDSLHREISGCIKSTAQRNKDNVLGKYIEDNYKEPEFK